MKLLIISHTDHYLNDSNQIVGWGPTITEINHLATVFDEVYHLGTFKKMTAPKSALPYTSDRIHFIGMPFTGGVRWHQKLDILWNAPATMYKVFRTLAKVDVFQLRCPTGIGVYLIPLLTLCTKKKGWYKYAGNWVQKKAPFGFAIQRWMLKKQSRKVTINGRWSDQPEHCHTFENPCLTETDLIEGKQVTSEKDFNQGFEFCFAGRLEAAKGVRRIIDAFSNLKDSSKVKTVHLMGNGADRKRYEAMAKKSSVNFVFHGFLSVQEVFEMYKKSHFFLLPSSASEGFPKVIAEAMNFGCIPIVSNVSSIGQYVKNEQNGFVVHPNTSEVLQETLEQILQMDAEELRQMNKGHSKVCSLFTYERYIHRIKNEIVS